MPRPVLKRYHFSALLDSANAISARIARIESLTQHTGASTQFYWRNDQLLRVSHAQGVRLSRGTPLTARGAQSIARTLDDAHAMGLAHGDIHRKNVAVLGDTAYLFDWEPSTWQIRNGRPTLMATAPWLADIDRVEGRLSIRTDLMCFDHLICPKPRSSYREPRWLDLIERLVRDVRPFTTLLDWRRQCQNPPQFATKPLSTACLTAQSMPKACSPANNAPSSSLPRSHAS